jgi:hypothetical protein
MRDMLELPRQVLSEVKDPNKMYNPKTMKILLLPGAQLSCQNGTGPPQMIKAPKPPHL